MMRYRGIFFTSRKTEPIAVGVLFLLIFLINIYRLPAQDRLMEDVAMMKKVEDCIDHIYHLRFDQALELTDYFDHQMPQHPAGSFLRGLIIYWRELPLISSNKHSDEFLSFMEETIRRARLRTDTNDMDLEGVFFELVAHGMIMMFHADDGNPGRVLPNLRPSYRMLRKGFQLESSFVEFGFTSGLYMYYIVAYPEVHPAYKPIALLFPPGGKEEGLRKLEKVSEDGIYLKNESRTFLNHLYLSYENNPASALSYIQGLFQNYPDTYYYRIKYILNLLALGYTDQCIPHVNHLRTSYPDDTFVKMVVEIIDGYLFEKVLKDHSIAREKYKQGIDFGKEFGNWVNNYLCIAYGGLSRIYRQEGNQRKAREYEKLARSAGRYAFLFELGDR